MTLQSEPKSPTVLNGRYVIELVLREGDKTGVYLARDERSHRDVVVKTARAAEFDEASVLVREREMLMRLDHPGIMRCLDFFKSDDLVALVLEHVPGQDLEQVLAARKRVDEKTAREWGVQLADILTVLHDQQPAVLYRDLKPSNVVLRPDGRLVLVDFGAARLHSQSPKDTVPLGTPGYAPPEQYGQGTDERADVYTLGVTLFELLSGRDPRDFGFSFPSLRELGVQVSPELDAIVQRAVQHDAGQRFPSIQAMRAALRPPRRNLTSLAVALCATLAYALGVVATPEPLLRFIFGAAAFACAAWAGLLRVSGSAEGRSDQDRPSWHATAARIAVVMGAAVLGAAPLVLPGPSANAHLRRLLLDASHRAVPVDGSSALLLGLVLLLGALGFMCGRAFTRRLPWPVPVGLAAFTAALLLGHLGLDTRADSATQATFNDPRPLWTKTLGAIGLQRLEIGMLDGSTETGRVGLRTEREYRVLDTASGNELFKGTTEMQAPLRAQNGMLVEHLGQRLTGRQVSDGKEAWHLDIDKPVLRVMMDADEIFVVAGATVRSIDPTSGRVRWTWTAPDNAPPLAMGGGFQVGPKNPGGVFVVASQGGRVIHGLDRASGEQSWQRDLDVTTPEFSFGIADRRVWVSQDRLLFINVNTGKTAIDVPFETAGFGGMMQVGDDRYIVSRADSILGVDGRDGHTLWTARVPGEALRVMQVSPTGVVVQEAGGRIMRLDGDTGRVAWEWWPGDFGAHLVPSNQPPVFVGPAPRALFVQAEPGSPLMAIDGDAGVVAWRHAVEPGTRVVRVTQGLHALLLLSYDAQQQLTLTALPPPAELVDARVPRPSH